MRSNSVNLPIIRTAGFLRRARLGCPVPAVVMAATAPVAALDSTASPSVTEATATVSMLAAAVKTASPNVCDRSAVIAPPELAAAAEIETAANVWSSAPTIAAVAADELVTA